MVASRVEGDVFRHFDSLFYHDQINKVIQHILPQFDRMVKRVVWFHLLFLTLLVSECFLFLVLLGFLIESSLVAASLALIFLTGFSYFALRLWITERKPKNLYELQKRYLKSCKHLLGYNSQIPEHLVELGNACGKFATQLTGREYHFWKGFRIFRSLSPLFERFSCFCHWKDVLMMKEYLLKASIEEHLKLVKCEPTSLEVHAGLANAYVMLSAVYQDPRLTDDRWLPQERYTEDLEKKFRQTAEKAIEEFKILSEFAPEDPWVHAQLAYSYQDLQMPKEEIREYEEICRLNPQDKDALFKLGVLYFRQGENALGLRIYEELKRLHYSRAEQLIEHYGNY